MIIHKNIIVKEIPNFKDTFSILKEKKCLFLDIETTGLSSVHNRVYLIGALVQKQEDFVLYQWFSPSPDDEKEILTAFLDFQTPYERLIHYNGLKFDLPFLKARCRAHQLSTDLLEKPSLDLFTKLKCCQTLLKLSSGRLAAWEEFLNLLRIDNLTGRKCIRLYQTYCTTKDETLLAALLAHNQEDLMHLPMLLPALAYRQIINGGYTLIEAVEDTEGITAKLSLPTPLPRLFSYGSVDAYITGEKHVLRLRLLSKDGKLKKYYDDYQNYYYLPYEDTAIHKHLGHYMAASLRQKATPQNCYTWFPISGVFGHNPIMIETYLKENLRKLLHLF